MTPIKPASPDVESEKDTSTTMPLSYSLPATEGRKDRKTAHPTHRMHRFNSRHDAISRSHMSPGERSFVDFVRCLHQAKAIVKELQLFSHGVFPALHLSPDLCDHLANSNQYAQSALGYVNDTFRKFTRLCKILLMVLSKMESDCDTPRERLDSFRAEVREEWRLATEIKQRLLSFIQQNVEFMSTPGQSPSGSTSTSSSTPPTSPPQMVAAHLPPLPTHPHPDFMP